MSHLLFQPDSIDGIKFKPIKYTFIKEL